ncbi:MAG: hypothetical protein DME24_13905, partial [Verrucomicrobia bacterium]
MVISFIRVTVVPLPDAAVANAELAALAASPAGADTTASLPRVAASAAAETAIPLRISARRNLSTARLTRICAA